MKIKKKLWIPILFLVTLFMFAPVAQSASPSPFIGQWEAIDVDGGDIRLAIGGPLGGPFRITWTESYFGVCGGEAGIARGTGRLTADNPYILEGDLLLTCFTTGKQVNIYPVWRYDPFTGWLTSQDASYGGFVTTWHRPGRSLPLLWSNIIAHPDQEWVEGMGFPEGTVVSLVVYEPDHVLRFAGTAVAHYPEWDPSGTTALFYLGDISCDLKAGDHLWMSDGMVARDLVVTTLQVTDVNVPAQTVSGIAAPGSEVVIEYPPDSLFLNVIADPVGNWTAVLPNLSAGDTWLASQFDGDGDMTRVAIEPVKIVVTSTADELADDGYCTLREAVIAANSNAASGAATGECPGGLVYATDTILLTPDTNYWLTTNGADEDESRTGDLDFRDNSAGADLVIRVADAGGATISQAAGVQDRVLDNLGAAVQIEGLTLTGGFAYEDSGGGIRNTGALDVMGCTLNDNSAWWGGGGIWSTGTLTVENTTLTQNWATAGGALVNRPGGMLTVTRSTITGNTADSDGGGITNRADGTATVDSSTISGNEATYGAGGGLFNEGSLTIVNTQVSGNSALNNNGGGVSNNGTMTVTLAIISANTTPYDGGGIVNSGVLILDNSVISSNSSAGGGGIANLPGGAVTISNGSLIGGDPSALEGNVASVDGGAIINYGDLLVADSSISGNSADYGGGIANWSGSVTLSHASITRNSVTTSGGGIHTKDGSALTVENGSLISGNSAAYDGGGINNWLGPVIIRGSTVSDNTARGRGGGIYNEDQLTVEHGSALSDNAATRGGGLFNASLGAVTLAGCTVSGNSAAISGGGLRNLGVMDVSACTVSGNRALSGGGLLTAFGSVMTIDRTIISANFGEYDSGGILNYEASLAVTNSALLGNTSPGNGDAVYSITEIPGATSVTRSCMVGNGDFAFFNESGAAQIATENWWGHPSGPSGAGSGSGDSVSDYVTFYPWLDKPLPICPLP